MTKNLTEIRRALEVLSHLSKDDYEGIEAELFATVAKLSADYESHVRYSVANNYIHKYIKFNLPCCPKCNDKDHILIASPTVELKFLSPYLDRRDESINMYSETEIIFSLKKYLSDEFDDFHKSVSKNLQENIYMISDHLFCSNCQVSFPPNEFVKNIWNTNLMFSDIVEWSKKYVESEVE